MIKIAPFPCFNQNPLRKSHTHERKSFFNPKGIFVFLLLIVLQSISISSAVSDHQNRRKMKVHPMPKRRNNITIQYYFNNSAAVGGGRRDGSHKKLRRLPHIFSRVLELPFRSDADVSVEEKSDCFRFVAETDTIGGVRAQAIEIHPGVVKVVIRPDGYLGISNSDDLELDLWRFRLPETTRPELASAVLAGGELVVTVPKGGEVAEGSGGGGDFRGIGNNNNNNNARLVLVQ